MITIMEIWKAPPAIQSAEQTHIMYIEMENVICNLTKANTSTRVQA